MKRNDRLNDNVEMTVTFFLFLAGCVLGKLSMLYYGESMLTFNIPALGTIIVGMLLFRGFNCLLGVLSNKKVSNDLEIKKLSDGVNNL